MIRALLDVLGEGTRPRGGRVDTVLGRGSRGGRVVAWAHFLLGHVLRSRRVICLRVLRRTAVHRVLSRVSMWEDEEVEEEEGACEMDGGGRGE